MFLKTTNGNIVPITSISHMKPVGKRVTKVFLNCGNHFIYDKPMESLKSLFEDSSAVVAPMLSELSNSLNAIKDLHEARDKEFTNTIQDLRNLRDKHNSLIAESKAAVKEAKSIVTTMRSTAHDVGNSKNQVQQILKDLNAILYEAENQEVL